MASSFDLTGLDKLSADLGRVPEEAGRNIQTAFIVTSAKIKKSWQKKLSGTPGVPFGPLTITYDVGANVREMQLTESGVPAAANHIESEIGAETGRKQAPIVTVIEFGAPSHPELNTVPHGYGAAALQENQEDFVKGLLLAISAPLTGAPSTGFVKPEGLI